MTFDAWADDSVIAEIGRRLRRERLDRNLTQAELASRSGVSEDTIRSIENGYNTSIKTLIRLLRAMGLVGRIESLVPEPGLSPIQVARMQGRVRQRARSGDGG